MHRFQCSLLLALATCIVFTKLCFQIRRIHIYIALLQSNMLQDKLPCAQLRLCVPSSEKQSGKQNSRSAFTISIGPYYILLIHLRKVIKFGISSRVSQHFLNRCDTKCFTL